ncbi:hypothetical protein KGM_207236 [Danaus plexippus plexippus]|uniref:Uncharacterized protein n=2 Tax=Danaus plexippus TaxID=13037 RepID=A0A212FA16_DANPL|nr:hypothetical protein KGM_207236 [Danaus plexippus plexippus]
MFKKKDLLVAQDTLYKEKIPFRSVYAKYGRIFKCPITYFRVVDRLGIGRGPRVEIIRGGLRHKYIVVRLTSPYNYPISVNVYVGCENKLKIQSSTPKIIVQTTVGEATVTGGGDIATTDNSAVNTTGGNSTGGGKATT